MITAIINLNRCKIKDIGARMGDKQGSEKKQRPDKDKTIFDLLFSRQERDQDYMPELKSQWEQMDNPDRIKFIIGGIAGLLLFIGALALTYYLLSLIIP